MERRTFIRGLLRLGAGAAVVTSAPKIFDLGRLITPARPPLPYVLTRDYYTIEWPVVTRQWTFGTYVHEVLEHVPPTVRLASPKEYRIDPQHLKSSAGYYFHDLEYPVKLHPLKKFLGLKGSLQQGREQPTLSDDLPHAVARVLRPGRGELC